MIDHSMPEPDVSPIDCDATVRRLWDYLDEELDTKRAEEVAKHLRDCAACREHFAFADHFLAALHQHWPLPSEPVSLRDRVVARLTAEGVMTPTR
ncbi:zf-HC2 domain-containing protein [Gemmatimonas sp.]